MGAPSSDEESSAAKREPLDIQPAHGEILWMVRDTIEIMQVIRLNDFADFFSSLLHRTPEAIRQLVSVKETIQDEQVHARQAAWYALCFGRVTRPRGLCLHSSLTRRLPLHRVHL